MVTWPSGNKAVTTTTDADSDSISGARVDVNKTVSNVNDVIDMFNISGSPTDNYILKYDTATSKFQMSADSGAGSGISDIVEDTTPELGGDLDTKDLKIYNSLNGKEIKFYTNGTGSNTITITIESTKDGVDTTPAVNSPGSNLALKGSNQIFAEVALTLQSYSVASLAGLTVSEGAINYCTDETGGAIPVFYDGTNWRRMSDRAIAS